MSRLRGVQPESFPGGHGAAIEWFDRERESLLLIIELAVQQEISVHAWKLAWTCQDFYRRRGYWQEWAASQRLALEAAMTADGRTGIARDAKWPRAGIDLAWQGGRIGAGTLCSAQTFSMHLATWRGWRMYISTSAPSMNTRDDFNSALASALKGLETAQRTNSDSLLAKALNNTGWYCAQLDNPRKALDYCLQALALHRATGKPAGEYNTLDSISFAYLNLGEYDEVRKYFFDALELHTFIGDRWGHAMTLMHLGDTEEACGNREAARPWRQQAHGILAQLEHPDTADVRERLDRNVDPQAK